MISEKEFLIAQIEDLESHIIVLKKRIKQIEKSAEDIYNA